MNLVYRKIIIIYIDLYIYKILVLKYFIKFKIYFTNFFLLIIIYTIKIEILIFYSTNISKDT